MKKEWIFYIKTLAAVGLLLICGRLVFSDSMIIYVQNEKPDFLQVFFQIDGAYTEENSQRSGVFDNPINGVKISLPFKSFNNVRIDPMNAEGEIVITKIEVNHLFSTQTFIPSDLLMRSKIIQMIDKFELNSTGLLIHSTGNDPAFELTLENHAWLAQFMILMLISLFLSFIIFLIAKEIFHFRPPPINKKILLFIIPLLFSIAVATLFYPGFMSYDTLHALRSARNGVTDSEWPPMVSYVWRFIELFSSNPSAMHFSQVLLLLVSIFFIAFFFNKKYRDTTIFLILSLSVPVILGTIAVIWKDVLMASFFFGGIAVILFMKSIKDKRKFILLSLLALFLIFLGSSSRHNAITAAVPLLFYLAFIVSSRFKITKHLWLSTILLGIMLTGITFTAKTQLDHYSLPEFIKMESANSKFLLPVRFFDVAGASLCVGENLFGDLAPNLSVAEIDELYDPRHINLSVPLLSKIGVSTKINKIWINVATHHPVCFFNYKWTLTKYLLGANDGEQFLITAPSVDENEFGYKLPDSHLRDLTVGYIVQASNRFFLRPWFIYLFSFIVFAYMLWKKRLPLDHFVIFTSALFYFASLVLFGNAADARLLFYSTTGFLIFIFISIFRSNKKHSR